MNRRIFLGGMALCALALAAGSQPAGVVVTYIANEGLLIEGAGKKILVDALFRDDIGYAPPATETLAQMEGAKPPFQDVSLVLATHFHRDHFNAPAVAAHLKANPRATFVSVQQAIEPLLKELGEGSPERARIRETTPEVHQKKRVTVDRIAVDAMRMRHGQTQNTSFLIHVGGKKILQLGDSDGEISNFDPFDLEKEKIDVAFVPYWYLLYDEGIRVIKEQIAAKQVVAFHIPSDSAMTAGYAEGSNAAGVAKHMKNVGGQAGLRARFAAAMPEAKAAMRPGERWTF